MRELFIISIVAICFLIAWGTSLLGVSLALGAFLAGLTISESPYSLQALSNILPFRDLFTSFFFISIGMLLDLKFLAEAPLLILGISVGILLLKTLLAGSATLLLKMPVRVAVLTGVALCQVGEFSFILAQVGIENQLLDQASYQVFLSVSILTMGLTPFLLKFAPRFADVVLRPVPSRYLREWQRPTQHPEQITSDLSDHLVIIGYGINGRNVARAAKAANIPYVIIEMNPTTVTEEREKGEPIFYGDASYLHVLEYAHIGEARIAVIAISDPQATRRIISTIRSVTQEVHLIVRTRFMNEVNTLHNIGADEVIPEEFETSIEIFTRVLSRYLVPQTDIHHFIQKIRSDNYDMFRSLSPNRIALDEVKEHVGQIDIATCKISEQSDWTNQSLSSLALRKRYKVNLLAIRREDEVLTQLTGDTVLQPEDVLILFGKPDQLQRVLQQQREE
jgi:CPA2 family monovalent cation:H+ antiporter-2